MEVMDAVRKSNLDVSANSIEINKVDYYIRGLGYIDDLEDLDQAVVKVTNNVPIRLQDVARINFGPQPRNMAGILDKGGAEAVGGVVIARYGDNPLQVIEGIKKEIEQLSPGLPTKTLADGTVSKLTLVPFYDRSGLIYETLGTLYEAINLQQAFYPSPTKITSSNFFEGNYYTGALMLEKSRAILAELNSLTDSEWEKRSKEMGTQADELYKQAVPYFTKALEIKPDNTDIMIILFQVHTRLKNTAEVNAMNAKISAILGANWQEN
jgi:tetratricopeptide (TPR) repeat protein